MIELTLLYLGKINRYLSILYFEKLQKVTELFSWFNHSLSNLEENGMCPYLFFILSPVPLYQHHIFPKDAAK
jgi:hypothetical protein